MLELQENSSYYGNPSHNNELAKPPEVEQKNKTPNVYKKPPASAFKKRPPLNKQAAIKQDTNLADIMQIKATPLETFQPQLKLPKVVPPINSEKKKRPNTPKVTNRKK